LLLLLLMLVVYLRGSEKIVRISKEGSLGLADCVTLDSLSLIASMKVLI